MRWRSAYVSNAGGRFWKALGRAGDDDVIEHNDDRRIRQMIDDAAQASARGRVQEADRLVREAEAEAPQHPLVLNETARRLLNSSDAAGAHALLTQAVSQDPSHASIWLNLASNT